MEESDVNLLHDEMPRLIAIPQVEQCSLDHAGHELLVLVAVSKDNYAHRRR